MRSCNWTGTRQRKSGLYVAWPLHVRSAGTCSVPIVSEWKQRPLADNCRAFHQVLHLVSQEATVWTPRREWLSVHGWVGCVGKASDRVVLDLSQRELAWWRLPGVCGREWQVLPTVTAACVKAQWWRWCEKRWAVVFISLRTLFIWANIFYISFFSPLLGHRYSIVTYVPEPLLRRGQSPDHFCNIYRIQFG